MNLTVRENKILNQLPAIQQEFVRARMETNLKNISERERKKFYVDLLTISSADAGQAFGNDAQILKFQTDVLYGEVQGKYLDLTPTEIRKAFNMGVRGEFGQWFGFCARTYHLFIKSYFELPDRQKSHLEYLKKVNEAESPTKVFHDAMFSQKAVKRAFEAYKDEGEFPLFAFAYYDVLVKEIGMEKDCPKRGKFKTLVTDDDTRKKIFEQTKIDYTAELTKTKIELRKKGRTPDIEAIEKLISSNFKGSTMLEKRFKAALLRYYFDQLITEGKDLNLTI